MLFRVRVPQPPLDAFVESIWVYRNDPYPHALERVLPTGAAQLIVNLNEDQLRIYNPERPHECTATPGTVLSGPRSGCQVIDTAEQEYVAGVVFRPGGSAAFMREPAHETSETDTPLDLLWGRQQTVDLRDRLLESGGIEAQLDVLEKALRAQLRPEGVHPAVAFALATFHQVPVTTSIGAVTDAIGMSAKRFIDRFKIEVGLTPKRYCRVRRFQQAVAQAHRQQRVDWTRVALDCGYFDQAHFIHEFRSFSGLTPSAYQASRTDFQNHVKFLQSSESVL
jgi:AraC-like DNA-binding protein